jgi:hypothetical protein
MAIMSVPVEQPLLPMATCPIPLFVNSQGAIHKRYFLHKGRLGSPIAVLDELCVHDEHFGSLNGSPMTFEFTSVWSE